MAGHTGDWARTYNMAQLASSRLVCMYAIKRRRAYHADRVERYSSWIANERECIGRSHEVVVVVYGVGDTVPMIDKPHCGAGKG
jgi:hypothetical protein